MKIALITATVGGFDTIKEIPKQTVDFDFIRLTDNDLIEIKGNARHKAKFPKMQGHLFTDADVIIWIDGSVQILSNNFVEYMANEVANYDIAIGKHNVRNCAYEEIDFICAEIMKGNEYLKRRYDFDTLLEVKNFLKTLGFEHNKGLYACGIFARKNNHKANNMFDNWWQSEMQWQTNDQPLFVYLANMYKVKINTLEWQSLISNQYFKLINHNE
jgi:hypothetical protein